MKTRQTLRAFAIGALAASALAGPARAYAQEEKCTSCEAADRDRLLRRYQQAIDRAQREITLLERQLTSNAELDSASVRRINERMQRAVEQLTRAQASQQAQLAATAVRRARVTPVVVAPRANAWMTQSMDGYIGVLWSASVDVERRKEGEALWTFHDYPQVEAVERESPAERAGILVGDVITAFDGKDLRTGKIPLNSILRPGHTVAVKVLREKRPRAVSVTVAPRPRSLFRTPAPDAPEVVQVPYSFERTPEPPHAPEAPRAARPMELPFATMTPAPLGAVPGFGGAAVGAAMIPLDRTLGEPYGIDYGLLVVQVGPQTPAARAGIQKGDVLIAVGGRELRSVGQLIRAVERAENDEVRLELLRKKVKKTLVMKW